VRCESTSIGAGAARKSGGADGVFAASARAVTAVAAGGVVVVVTGVLSAAVMSVERVNAGLRQPTRLLQELLLLADSKTG
jgi:hypothetical protein